MFSVLIEEFCYFLLQIRNLHLKHRIEGRLGMTYRGRLKGICIDRLFVFSSNIGVVNRLLTVFKVSRTGKSEMYEKAAFSCISDACPAYIFDSLPLYVLCFLYICITDPIFRIISFTFIHLNIFVYYF